MEVYFDESNSALVPLFIERKKHHTVLYPGHPDCEIQRGAKDVEWIAVAGQKGWLAVTWDHRILRNEDERRAVLDNSLKFIFVSNRRKNRLQHCRNLVWVLSQIPELGSMPGPLMIRIYRERRTRRRRYRIYRGEELEQYISRLNRRPLRSGPRKRRYYRRRRRRRSRNYRRRHKSAHQRRDAENTDG